MEPVWLKEVKAMMEGSQFFKELEAKHDRGKLSKDEYHKVVGFRFI